MTWKHAFFMKISLKIHEKFWHRFASHPAEIWGRGQILCQLVRSLFFGPVLRSVKRRYEG